MVILIGGFGRSEYLFRQIDEYCKERDMNARKPLHPWVFNTRDLAREANKVTDGPLWFVALSIEVWRGRKAVLF